MRDDLISLDINAYLPQHRHSYIAHLIGIRNFVLAVNKMDLIGFDQGKYFAIVAAYGAFAAGIGIKDVVAVPISGLAGDNISTRSQIMPWYTGTSLLEHLETVEFDADAAHGLPFRMSVQWVNRVDSPYEAPLSPEIHINTSDTTPAQAANLIIDRLLGGD